MTATGSGSDALAAEVAALTWYHTIELPGGVVTPGEYDTRVAARKVALPAALDGLRCRERLQSFACAHRALDSRVGRHDVSVYRLGSAGLGTFDFDVLVGGGPYLVPAARGTPALRRPGIWPRD